MHLPSPRKTLLITIPALLAYVGLVFAVSEVATSFPWVVVSVLAIAMAAGVGLYLDLQQAHSRLKTEYTDVTAAGMRAKAIEQMNAGMVSLVLYLAHDPPHDEQHRFSRILEEYVIHGDDGTYNWRLLGSNAGTEASEEMTIKVAGDGPLDEADFQISVTDGATREELEDVNICEDTPHIKTLTIPFPKPLTPGESFDLHVSARWKNSFLRSRRDDYVFFVWGHYPVNGVDELVARLVSDVPLTNMELLALSASGAAPATVQPQVVDSSRNHYTVECKVKHPREVFLLKFRKEIPYS